MPHHLVSQAQRGDHDAFSALITERIPRLYGVAGLITGRRDLAEDAVQEALIHAWRDLPRLREADRFDAWLHRLLVNACHDQGRRLRRQRGETPLTDQQFTGDRDPAQTVVARDEIERAFRWLSHEDRTVVVLRHYLGMSTREASAAMGMREGTLKSRLHRAMKSMAAAIAAEATHRNHSERTIGMNTEDRQAAERRLAAWLNEAAPIPPTDLTDRILAHTSTLPQRGRAGIMDMFAFRALGVAAIVAAAVVVGLNLSRVIGPEPPVGASPSPTTEASESIEPTATPPASGEATSSAAAAEPGRIAFQADRANETSGIYVMNADGSNAVQLVDDPAVHEMSPSWSPDGSLIAYITMSAEGTMQGGVFIIDAQGGEPIPVDDNYAYAPATWSPDGSMLAVGGDGSERGIGVYHVAEARFDSLTEDGGTAPLWSPDGSRIAYNVAPPNDIRIVDVASGETRNLTDDAWNDSVARWSEDGTQLIFVSDRDTDQSRDSARSWIVSADGGEPELLGDEPVLAFAHWPSPDGEWLAYIHPDGSGLHLSRADASEDRVVHATEPADGGASWASDSSGFVFSNAGEAPRDIFLMRVDADAPEQLTDDPADESAPNWGPPGS